MSELKMLQTDFIIIHIRRITTQSNLLSRTSMLAKNKENNKLNNKKLVINIGIYIRENFIVL